MGDLHTDLDEGVLIVRIERAASRNTITYAVLDEFLDVFDRVSNDSSIRAVVVTASGEIFSAGTDLAPRGGGYEVDGPTFKPLRGGTRDIGGELALRVFACDRPVLAAINGTAVGIGATMVLPMDIRIAADRARFGFPFTRRGIVPESCATWFLPRIVGIATAVDWAVTGRIFDAPEALASGLVHQVVPAGEVLDRTLAIAHGIATSTSAVSVALTRQMLWRQLGSPHPLSANRLESLALLAVGTMDDAKEGVAAFREKRPARFRLRVPDDLPGFYPWFDEEPFDA